MGEIRGGDFCFLVIGDVMGRRWVACWLAGWCWNFGGGLG